MEISHGNAVKYTQKGYITFRVRYKKESEHECRLCVRVTDTGIGIKREDLTNIFSNFTQVDTKRNRAIEGTGLGLAITKRMVEMMGGTLGVDSAYGEGSTFSFEIVN